MNSNYSRYIHDTSPIMKSFNFQSLNSSGEEPNNQPDVTKTTEYTSLVLEPNSNNSPIGGFLLIDENENLKVSNVESFYRKLECDQYTKVKVISIFGNTGDGKSHTLNHTFFRGFNVFKTSEKQDSCTIGAWAAYDNINRIICIDTEGMLGIHSQEGHRKRLLLKILAISDIVIYRTRAERLLSDMFLFIGTASKAYCNHFQRALHKVNSDKNEYSIMHSGFGPSLIIFHETRNTQPISNDNNETPEEILRGSFEQQNYNLDAFSSLHYVGIKTNNEKTDFSKLKEVIKSELENTSVRSARSPHIIYNTLKAFNEKFSDRLVDRVPVFLPDQYFTCSVECLSCEQRCQATMGHLKDGLPHSNSKRCRFQHQFNNCTYICKVCHTMGKETKVAPRVTSAADTSWLGFAKYALSGYVIECPECGEIYRSRQYWYGNKEPEDHAVRTEIQHVWPGSNECAIQSQNAAQKVIDGVSYLTETVANISSPPAKYVSSWFTDQINPSYWRPNHEIKECHKCKKDFGSLNDSKHHCRACGEGFCDECSKKTMPVPERNWNDPVRVCDTCYDSKQNLKINKNSQKDEDPEESNITVRKYGEAVFSTLSTFASILDYPKELIKDTARPSYWVPDSEVKSCCVCDCPLGSSRQPLHHCRDCGKGVCCDCSNSRKTVPKRGWDRPVRVCKTCFKK